MEEYVSLVLHNEYAKRVDDENRRQNNRITNLEKAVEENSKLVVSIEKLTMSVQSMVEEQKAQGVRLETLENRDGEMWRKVIWYVLSTLLGVAIGYIFKFL